jgi:hypothetical protein
LFSVIIGCRYPGHGDEFFGGYWLISRISSSRSFLERILKPWDYQRGKTDLKKDIKGFVTTVCGNRFSKKDIKT